MDSRRVLLELYREAIQAVLPGQLIRDALTVGEDHLVVQGRKYGLPTSRRVHLFGSGKASIPAAREVEALLGDRLAGGVVVSNYDDNSLTKVTVCVGSHPVPDQRSIRAAERLGEAMGQLESEDLFIYLLSGGSSALLEQPLPSLSLDDLRATSTLLLKGGLAIDEINAVRKHLSQVKGGRLARRTAARGVVLVISDVIGDDLETIGSAPLYCDRSTYQQVASILSRYDLWEQLPSRVGEVLAEGRAGSREETPKEPNPRIDHFLVGSNSRALQQAKAAAEAKGIPALIMSSRLRGEAREAAKVIVALGEEILATGQPFTPPVCLLFGGETTVRVRGNGRGGRNQELCLAALSEIRDRQGMTLLSAGTDGIDGNSDAAGAVVDHRTFGRVRDLGLRLDEALSQNDSNTLFARTGDSIVTGPTGTNVMDLTMLLVG